MLSANDLDGIDFKPFFDMVVGVLFVLLILIGALLFFQTAQQVETAQQAASSAQQAREAAAREAAAREAAAREAAAREAQEAQRHRREWQAQEAEFLNRLAGHLHARGIEAQVDLANSAVIIPLGTVARLGPDGLPDILGGPANDLGQVLAQDLGCVTIPVDHAEACAAFRLLHLNNTVAQVRTGSIGAVPVLPQDRFGHLLTNMLSAVLLRGSPDLLRLSSSFGAMVWQMTSTVGTATATLPGAINGDLGISFEFAPP